MTNRKNIAGIWVETFRRRRDYRRAMLNASGSYLYARHIVRRQLNPRKIPLSEAHVVHDVAT